MKKLILVIYILLMSVNANAVGTPAEYAQLNRELSSQIGRMPYDEAISKLGQPDRVTQGDKIFVAEWTKLTNPVAPPVAQNVNVNFNQERRSNLYYMIKAAGERKKREAEFQRLQPHGVKIVFSFDKTTRLLTWWNVREF